MSIISNLILLFIGKSYYNRDINNNDISIPETTTTDSNITESKHHHLVSISGGKLLIDLNNHKLRLPSNIWISHFEKVNFEDKRNTDFKIPNNQVTILNISETDILLQQDLTGGFRIDMKSIADGDVKFYKIGI